MRGNLACSLWCKVNLSGCNKSGVLIIPMTHYSPESDIYVWADLVMAMSKRCIRTCPCVCMLCSQLTLSAGPASRSLYVSSGGRCSCPVCSAETPLHPRQRWSQRFLSRYASAGSRWSSCSPDRYLRGTNEETIEIAVNRLKRQIYLLFSFIQQYILAIVG